MNTRAATPCIEFVNHASVLLSDGRVGVLSDPWYFGATFHQGWSLLVENDDAYLREVLGRTDYIWISHEHPDHFSPPFFKRYGELIRARGIRMLFQATRDGRVAGFLRANGFEVIEMRDGEPLQLSDVFSVRTVRSDLYDSALLADVAGMRVFNLNDCPLTSLAELQAFKARYGSCDVLLTQFSYAAWKGGRAHRAWRERAAKAKLQAMRRQIEILQPATCIPFASFVRFSHELNAYMNDAVNRPRRVRTVLKTAPAQLLFMRPQEIQPLADLRADPASFDFWQAQFERIEALPLSVYPAPASSQVLGEAFRAWQQRVFARNSRLLMRLARRLLPFHPFSPTVVRLIDSGAVLRVDMLGELEAAGTAAADIELHSASLEFLFRNDFGLDTLFVNGCFEELRPGGFDAFAKCFAVGNLNAMGLYVGPSLLRRLDVVALLLRKLLTVRKNMAVAA